MANKYDIFISYRRKDAGDKAEHLKDLLEPHYKKRISFDRENLTGKFNVQLIERIDSVKDFVLVIGKNSFKYTDEDRSDESVAFYSELLSLSQEDFAIRIDELGPDANIDYVRIEIGRALRRRDIHIIPIVPERTDNYNFATLNLPADIAGIKTYEAVFYSDSPDALFKDVLPKVRKHMKSRADLIVDKTIASLTVVALILCMCVIAWSYIKDSAEREKNELIEGIEKCLGEKIIPENIYSTEEVKVLHNIIAKMRNVYGDSIKFSAFETTIEEYNTILNEDFDKEKASLPISDVTFWQALQFIERLNNMINSNEAGIMFSLPNEKEWEYAASGGNIDNPTKYAGSDDINKVAWYNGNSEGQVHAADGQSYLTWNKFELFDMSGNVSEYVYTQYKDLDNPNNLTNMMLIKGGNYQSDPQDCEITSSKPFDINKKSSEVGFRLVLRKNY